ncbi:MAG: hypothetical protein Kow0080_26690 [Candidatus Promineifilaceae bacterium]
MTDKTTISQKIHSLGLVAILFVAAGLRLWALPAIPPGLTHDEADHGITAWSIVQGVREIYFEIGYGREPLYDYATAGIMSLIGPTYVAGRVTAVAFGLVTIAAMAAWTSRAFNKNTALLTAAGLAAGFWPLMTSRQMLRSTTLPALFTIAAFFFWQAFSSHQQSGRRYIWVVMAGLLLGLSFYTYIPARVLWAVFLITAVYTKTITLKTNNSKEHKEKPFNLRHLQTFIHHIKSSLKTDYTRIGAGWQTFWLLVIAGLVALPLLTYLQSHSGLEVRIDELSAPLKAARSGDWQPLEQNIQGALKLFTISGDTAWRYNIPGRPFLPPVLGVFFYAGVLLASWWVIRPFRYPNPSPQIVHTGIGAFFALAWLAAGTSPVLVTGPELATTQAIGMQPVLYLFPALALVTLGQLVIESWKFGRARRLMWAAALLLYAGIGTDTAVSYFHIWANTPEVRVQYETTMTTVFQYLNQTNGGDTAVSTITPLAEHTPAVAAMTLSGDSHRLRYFDGRSTLLIPATPKSRLIFTGFSALAQPLTAWFDGQLVDELPLRDSDLDRPVWVYQVDGAALLARWQAESEQTAENTAVPANVDNALIFHGFYTGVEDGHLLVITWWELLRPLPNAVIFTHLLDNNGQIIGQQDQLGAPANLWQPGDHLLQLHQIPLPPEWEKGQYQLAVGVYTCLDTPQQCKQTQRLPIIAPNQPAIDHIRLPFVPHTLPAQPGGETP